MVKLNHTNKTKFAFAPMPCKGVVWYHWTLHLTLNIKITQIINDCITTIIAKLARTLKYFTTLCATPLHNFFTLQLPNFLHFFTLLWITIHFRFVIYTFFNFKFSKWVLPSLICLAGTTFSFAADVAACHVSRHVSILLKNPNLHSIIKSDLFIWW